MFSNNLVWVFLLVVNYIFIALCFRFFKKEGMFGWVVLSSILANIQVLKTIELFGIVTTLGNIIYGTSFLATDILSECYSKEEANKAVKLGTFSLIATTVIMQICLLFQPHVSDVAHTHLYALFSLMPRVAAASLVSYFVSNSFDVWFYHFLKEAFPEKLWLRNNAATMTAQFIDTTLFTLLAFYGVFEGQVLFEVFISTYLLKWIVALLDTPVIYWAKKHHEKELVQEKDITADKPQKQ